MATTETKRTEAKRTRKPMTDEQRKHWNEYNRNYRREHPERVAAWTANYIMRKAAKLQAAGGGVHAGD